jgi:1-deoxy-D-xylulose-5-phosphate synthase
VHEKKRRLLDAIDEPRDLRNLSYEELEDLAQEIRDLIIETVTTTGGHLGSNLGIVELTLAIHRVFSSPKDIVLWDTGHQAYVHKLVTGRRDRFSTLRQAGGLSGYPNRAESPHDWVENSHASTILSYAHGLTTALGKDSDRKVIAVLGDGALTGGMAYEALNNIGHSEAKVLIVLNDNGRSYAPTVSKLSEGLAHLRLNPSYVQAREHAKRLLRSVPGLGGIAYSGVYGITAALREAITPHRFFETLGVRYAGPIDGHDIVDLESALANAAQWDGPIVLHVLTQKGRGYGPAENDEIQRLHDFKVPQKSSSQGHSRVTPDVKAASSVNKGFASYTEAFSKALVEQAEQHEDVIAITAAMPGPTGLLPFKERWPDRFIDVGIAEQHAVTMAAGLAMGGKRPVVAIYSTFLTRAFDQLNMDVGLHGLSVVFVADRAGITGDDGASHHGLLDMALALQVPGMTVFAPSSAEDIAPMLESALALEGPSLIRFPKTPPPLASDAEVQPGLSARMLCQGDGEVCILAVGKMVHPALEAVEILRDEGIHASLWDVRVVKPADPEMLRDAASHRLVVTVEDGTRIGGAGSFLLEEIEPLRAPGSIHASRVLGVPNAYIPHGKPADILHSLGLDGPGIAASVRAAMEEAAVSSSRPQSRQGTDSEQDPVARSVQPKLS